MLGCPRHSAQRPTAGPIGGERGEVIVRRPAGNAAPLDGLKLSIRELQLILERKRAGREQRRRAQNEYEKTGAKPRRKGAASTASDDR